MMTIREQQVLREGPAATYAVQCVVGVADMQKRVGGPMDMPLHRLFMHAVDVTIGTMGGGYAGALPDYTKGDSK